MTLDISSQIVVFYVREGRDRAIPLAKEEALNVLAPFSPKLMDGGPLTGQKKVFCIEFPLEAVEQDLMVEDFKRLGYTEKISTVTEISGGGKKRSKPNKDDIVWKGRTYKEDILYEEDKEEMRLKDPDQRTFLLKKESGVEAVKGYRGHGEHFGRRALPVSDCRLLVNLALPQKGFDKSTDVLLDPFAGAGGVVIEAREFGLTAYSMDVDDALVPGLSNISAKHFNANATDMVAIASESIDAIATEVPFEEKFTPEVVKSFKEMHRVLKPNGKIAMMTALHQADAVEKSAADHGFKLFLKQVVDRKGTDVEIFVFEKDSKKKVKRINGAL